VAGFDTPQTATQPTGWFGGGFRHLRLRAVQVCAADGYSTHGLAAAAGLATMQAF